MARKDLRTLLARRVQVEEDERRWRKPARYVPLLRVAMDGFGLSADAVRTLYRQQWQQPAAASVRGAFLRLLSQDAYSRTAYSPATIERLPRRFDHLAGFGDFLRAANLTWETAYLCALYELAGADTGEDPQRKADALAGELVQLDQALAAIGPEEATFRDVTVDRQTVKAAYYAIAPTVPLGQVSELVNWARQHRRELEA